MANTKSTAAFRFAPKENSNHNLIVMGALLTLDNERLTILDRVNNPASSMDSIEHTADLFRVVGLNLALQQLRMGVR